MEKNKIIYSIYKYILGIIFIIYYKPKFINKNYILKECTRSKINELLLPFKMAKETNTNEHLRNIKLK